MSPQTTRQERLHGCALLLLHTAAPQAPYTCGLRAVWRFRRSRNPSVVPYRSKLGAFPAEAQATVTSWCLKQWTTASHASRRNLLATRHCSCLFHSVQALPSAPPLMTQRPQVPSLPHTSTLVSLNPSHHTSISTRTGTCNSAIATPTPHSMKRSLHTTFFDTASLEDPCFHHNHKPQSQSLRRSVLRRTQPVSHTPRARTSASARQYSTLHISSGLSPSSIWNALPPPLYWYTSSYPPLTPLFLAFYTTPMRPHAHMLRHNAQTR